MNQMVIVLSAIDHISKKNYFSMTIDVVII